MPCANLEVLAALHAADIGELGPTSATSKSSTSKFAHDILPSELGGFAAYGRDK